MKLIVISEHPCSRLGIATVLRDVAPDATVLEANSIDHFVALNDADGKVDLVLLDAGPRFDCEMRDIAKLQEIDDVGAMMVLHDHDQPELVHRYLDMGVQGVLPKKTELSVLGSAVQLVLSGARYVPESILVQASAGFSEPENAFEGTGLAKLTRRQMDVLKELGRGASNQEIGTQLGIALATVKLHVNAILNTLGVRNRTEAAIIAYRAGVTDFSQSR